MTNREIIKEYLSKFDEKRDEEETTYAFWDVMCIIDLARKDGLGKWKLKKYRWIQIVTHIHCIHHIYRGYSWKMPILNFAYSAKHGWYKLGAKEYHDCTTTNIY